MPAAVTAEELGHFDMLEGVSLAAREDLVRSGVVRHAREGAVLMEQGKRNEAIYLVLEGTLGVHLENLEHEPVALIGAGETVGELSMLDGSDASAFVVARSPCRLLSVDEQAFWRMVHASHGFAVNLLVKLAQRLRANNETVSTNVMKRRQFERAAMFDGLTGIHNRRWLDETLHRLVERHRGDGGDLCVSLIDIDHFKGFNDTYGHDAGDYVLTHVATLLTGNLRPTDLVARFGGEEFVIIFPDTELGDAVVAADRVRVVIAETEQEMPDGPELPRVTISMGVAQLRSGLEVAEFLKLADQAMYLAKERGRHRVCTEADLSD